MSRGRRRAERVLLATAAAWMAALAAITLFPFQAWLTSSGYQVLEKGGELAASGLVVEAAGVVRIYGIFVLLIAVITAIVAWRLSSEHRAAVVWWLAFCTAISLLTRDPIATLLFGVALVFYLSRSRAASKASSLLSSAMEGRQGHERP